MSADETLKIIKDARASAILRTDDPQRAAKAMDAAIRGGFRVVEFTLTIPGVYDLIREFSAREGLTVGAGTVLTVEQARDAVRAGARFLVSPVIDEEVIAAAHALDVVAMPGCHTPTELHRAARAGAQLQKLFPAPAGGPGWLRSVMGPLPMLNVVPTNGIDAGNIKEWFDAGAVGAGFVAPLFPRDVVLADDFDEVESRARTLLGAVAEA